jgi:hypothetical protein
LQCEAVIQGLRSPLNDSRSVVVFALRDRHNVESFANMLLPASTAGSVYGTVGIAQSGQFHSFDLGKTYQAGTLNWRGAVNFWVNTYLWIMPLAILLSAGLWTAWLDRWLERRARFRLQTADHE